MPRFYVPFRIILEVEARSQVKVFEGKKHRVLRDEILDVVDADKEDKKNGKRS